MVTRRVREKSVPEPNMRDIANRVAIRLHLYPPDKELSHLPMRHPTTVSRRTALHGARAGLGRTGLGWVGLVGVGRVGLCRTVVG